MTYLLIGGVTDTAVVVAAKATPSASCRLALSASESDFSGATYTDTETAGASGWVKLPATGLTADTVHWFRVEIGGVLDTEVGRVRTLPTIGAPASFSIGGASCQGHVIPGSADDLDAPVFDYVRQLRLAAFLHLGDWHYGDSASEDPAVHLGLRELPLTHPNNARWLREQPLVYCCDDHDAWGAGGTADGTDSGMRTASIAAYHDMFPTYPLDDPGVGTYQSFRIGRCWVIVLDARTYRDTNGDPPSVSKSMLGAGQKQWLKDELAAAKAADAPFILVASPNVWLTDQGPADDSWGLFTDERQELANYIAAEGLGSRLVLLTGDSHCLAIGAGSHGDYSRTGWGRVPVVNAAPLNCNFAEGTKGGPYESGKLKAGGSFATFTVTDTGEDTVTVEIVAHNVDVATGEHTVFSTLTLDRGPGAAGGPFAPYELTVAGDDADWLGASAAVSTGAGFVGTDVRIAT